MAANPRSQLDPAQIIKDAYDEPNQRFRVDAEVTAVIAGPIEVAITQTDDSIRIGDGTNLVTTTSVSSDVGLDVNIIGGTLDVSVVPAGLSVGIKTTAMTVTDVPVELPSSPLLNRNTISVRIIGSNTIYFGNSTVTTANGYPKNSGEEIAMDIKDNMAVALYAVCDSGLTSDVRILEIA